MEQEDKADVIRINDLEMPKKWEGVTLANATEAQIKEMIDNVCAEGKALILHLPMTEQGAWIFARLFICLRCGHCCRGEDLPEGDKGIVLMPGEPAKLASFLMTTSKKFRRQYCKGDNTGLYLQYPCPFYKPLTGCTIYPYRPFICRTFPLHSPVKFEGLHPDLDGVEMMTADSSCPAVRSLVFKMEKLRRDILHFGEAHPAFKDELSCLSRGLWQQARAKQKRMPLDA